MTDNKAPQISVVTSLYNSAQHLEAFCEQMISAIKECYNTYELILVNDGSDDESLSLAKELLGNSPFIKIIDLTRNFGQHRALMAGIKASKGDHVLLIACDLEEQPDWLKSFKGKLEESDAEVVYGINVQKAGGLYKRLTSKWFYKVFNWLSPVKLTPDIILFRLLKRAYVNSLLQFEEIVLFLPGVMEMAGHKQISLTVNKSFKGTSSYNISRLMHMAIDAITSFSTKPLTLLMLTGLIMFGFSIFSLVFLSGAYFYKTDLSYQSLLILISIWGATGMLLSAMGIVGLYASRALIESKRRPQAIVKAIYQSEDAVHEN